MSLIFKLYYNPKIIGINNIPKIGPTILCGNHLNELDSKLVKSVINRSIYWNNHNYEKTIEYLNNDYIIGTFPERTINIYRLVQLKIMSLENKIKSISNNENIRSNDKIKHINNLKKEIEIELINLEIAKQQLEEKGFKVINHDTLLPFDKNIVKLAKQTNSQIVPFAINGTYIHGNNDLIIRFGNPISVTDSINESNNIIRENVKKLEYKNLKNDLN